MQKVIASASEIFSLVSLFTPALADIEPCQGQRDLAIEIPYAEYKRYMLEQHNDFILGGEGREQCLRALQLEEPLALNYYLLYASIAQYQALYTAAALGSDPTLIVTDPILCPESFTLDECKLMPSKHAEACKSKFVIFSDEISNFTPSPYWFKVQALASTYDYYAGSDTPRWAKHIEI